LHSHQVVHELLLVEDDPVIRQIATYVFSANGFVVTPASSFAEAMLVMENKDFDLLVSDLNLSGEHEGLSVIKAMQQMQPSAVTFILTATPDAKSILWAIRHHVDGYFRKSSDLHAVARQVLEYVRSRRQRSPAAA